MKDTYEFGHVQRGFADKHENFESNLPWPDIDTVAPLFGQLQLDSMTEEGFFFFELNLIRIDDEL